MAIIKRNYELSVWDEYLNSEGIKAEKKGAIIGASNMDFLGRATNINLKREIRGTNVLTFSMPQKYFDSKIGEYVQNELINELYNEKKIKLNFDGKWYEFYIKEISEEKQFKSLIKTFTCRDSFIDELSRTGYEIIFDEELYNNVDEIGNFMNVILDDSVWDYRADLNCGDFTEFSEERFYKIPLSQFGGKIKAYPLNLKVDENSFSEESEYFKKVVEQKGEFIPSQEIEVKNIFFDKIDQLELGDDLSREKEIFWDNYYKDNGFKLLDDNKMVELSGDYIYVPYTCLSFIYGNIFTNAYKSTEEPAMYGDYEDDKKHGYALQPSSKNPTDLIQFIFFKENDKILIDEEGVVVNNDCHYVIKISQWNELLRQQLKEKESLIYWFTSDIPELSQITTKYDVRKDGDIFYSKGVKQDTRTIDDFEWYPVYYEGYMEFLGDKEVYAARKISIADRTEYNLESEYYCTVYNNKDSEYIGLYSEKEIEDLIKNKNNEFRILSHIETRIILPTLARNLIQNGQKITEDNGWETLTQNDTSDYDTGSYANLLEISVKSTSKERLGTEATGDTDDEIISDYYLELLSPNIAKANNMDLEGTVSTDYALNFGLSSADIQIEKDKVYAIRICTGKWEIEDYNIILRNNIIEYNGNNKDSAAVEKYTNTLKSYYDFLNNIDLNIFTEENSEEDIKTFLKQKVSEHDLNIEDILLKWESCYLENDYSYLIYRIYENNKNEEKMSLYKKLDKSEYENWLNNSIIPNKVFIKGYNLDLDKIVIGEGSIDINGNYTLSGVTSKKDSDKFISFNEIFEKIENNNLNFIPDKSDMLNIKKNPLLCTIYYEKENEKWIWKEEKTNEISVPDNAFVLFKAKANIISPYVGIRVDSEPMTVNIESTKSYNYGETDYSGVKLETYSKGEDNLDYLVDGASIKIYKVDNNNFSETFLNNIGWKLEEKNTSNSSSNGDFSDVGATAFSRGIDVSYYQGTVDWNTVKSSNQVDFAILRIGYGDGTIDSQFERNYTECKKNNIPVGGYWYCYAKSAEEAKIEAQACLQAIKGKSFEYPIYYDIEEKSNINYVNQIAPAFCELLSNAGIYVGLYSYASALENQFSKELINKYPIWVAQFGQTPGDVTAYSGHFEIHQYSSTGKVSGIIGNVDLNECYKNYPAIIGDSNTVKNQFVKKVSLKNNFSISENLDENITDNLNFIKTYKGTYYTYGEDKIGGSGRKLIDCSIGDNEIKGSIASRDLFEKYSYNYNNERTKVYLEVKEYPEMNGFYYLDDSNAEGILDIIDFFYIYGSNCPFQREGTVTVDCYIKNGDSSNTNSNQSPTAGQDKINRENPNNDYTLNDDSLLATAKPAWTGTSSSIEPLFFNALLPKNGDTCSMAYALFINDFYYGIFWLDKSDTSTEEKPDSNGEIAKNEAEVK